MSPADCQPSTDEHHWSTLPKSTEGGSGGYDSGRASRIAAERTASSPTARVRRARVGGTSWAFRTFELSGWIESARKLRECNDEGTLIAFHPAEGGGKEGEEEGLFRVTGSGKNKKGAFIVSGTLDPLDSTLRLCFHLDQRSRFSSASPTRRRTLLSRKERRTAAAAAKRKAAGAARGALDSGASAAAAASSSSSSAASADFSPVSAVVAAGVGARRVSPHRSASPGARRGDGASGSETKRQSARRVRARRLESQLGIAMQADAFVPGFRSSLADSESESESEGWGEGEGGSGVASQEEAEAAVRVARAAAGGTLRTRVGRVRRKPQAFVAVASCKKEAGTAQYAREQALLLAHDAKRIERQARAKVLHAEAMRLRRNAASRAARKRATAEGGQGGARVVVKKRVTKKQARTRASQPAAKKRKPNSWSRDAAVNKRRQQ